MEQDIWFFNKITSFASKGGESSGASLLYLKKFTFALPKR